MQLVVLSFGTGSLEAGFPNITAQIWQAQGAFPGKVTAKLPPTPSLFTAYSHWRELYLKLQGKFSLRIKFVTEEVTVTNYSDIDFRELCQQLKSELNAWLSSLEFARLEKQLRTQLDSDQEVLILIESEDDTLQHLPWHLWELWDDYPKAELALGTKEYLPTEASLPTAKGLVRVLAILGDSTNINVEVDQQFLQTLSNAEVTFLVEPTLEELHNTLWDEVGWDILFFAGHSHTQHSSGYISLNPLDDGCITTHQLKYALQRACSRGLQVAIFNSCDGLGLGQELADLQIPQTIVMREPVPDPVAQAFLKFFLPPFASGHSLVMALREARERLQSLEPKYLCASWLPILTQNPTTLMKGWHELGRPLVNANACPYRGLLAFQEADAPFFRGRERLTQQLLKAVQTQPLTAVIGASGIGKSSLVFAGLVPQLRRREAWHIFHCRPGKQPLSALFTALSSGLGISTPHSNSLSTELAQWLEWQPPCNVLLIIDQFEELYTLTSEVRERENFIAQLLETVEMFSCVKVVITLRADFVGHALAYRPLADILQNAHLMVSPMNRAEVQAVITQPAAFLGVQFEEGLSERLLDAIANEPGHLPLLEFTLAQLWEKRRDGKLTHRAYQELGGVSEALSHYAQQVYDELTREEQQAARRIFLSLTQVSDGIEDTRRQVEQRDLLETDSAEIVEQVLHKLTAAKLVITNKMTDSEPKVVVDLAHEALIRHWSLLSYWVQENRDILQQAQRLEREAELWFEQGQSRQKEYLLQGMKLHEAMNFVTAQKDVVFSAQVRALIAASDQFQRKQRLMRMASVTIAIITFIGALVGWGLVQYDRYWNGTMRRVQTVDFNLLFHTLPYKLSAAMTSGETEEIQRVLDSNYSLFGLVVTDCQRSTVECPEQTILYQTRNQHWWNQEFSVDDLDEYHYSYLRNPPPFYTEQRYAHPNEMKPITTEQINEGEVIGRVYYIRRKTRFRPFWHWIFATK